MGIDDLTEEQRAEIQFVRDGLRVSKVVATRAVKTRNGDFFVGLSAAWDTTQEDAGGMGADIIDAMDEGEQEQAIIQRGMSLRRAKIAGYVLGMQVDIQAASHALAGGAISEQEFTTACKAIKRNYARMLAGVMKGGTT